MKLDKAAGDKRNKVADDAPLNAITKAGKDSESDLGATAAEGGISAVVGLGITDDNLFGVVNERAAAWAEARAAELVSDIDESTRNMINVAVSEGIANGQTVDEIASNIEDLTGFSSERADLIANTEVATANSQGALEGFKEVADTTDLNPQKVWLLGENACDDCVENADEGPIDLDDVFPSGDDAPPAHPNCRCALGVSLDGADITDIEEQDSEE